MPRPMIIGMSPSRRYKDRAWDERADSTKFLAEVILGSNERIPELKRLFDMQNLNREAPSNKGSYAAYDAGEAQETLERLAADIELDDRLIVLLGDKVAKSFDRFMGSKVLYNRNKFMNVESDAHRIKCLVLYVFHPSYFVTQEGKEAGKFLGKIAQDRVEIEPPLKNALNVAHQEEHLAEQDRLAAMREEQDAAEYNVMLANEEYDRQMDEEYLAAQGDEDSDDEEHEEEYGDELDRYERLIEGGWEED